MSFQVLAGNTTFAVLSLTILSLKLCFEKQNVLLKTLGKRGQCNAAGAENVGAELDARMEVHFVLLKSVATVSRVFEVSVLMHQKFFSRIADLYIPAYPANDSSIH